MWRAMPHQPLMMSRVPRSVGSVRSDATWRRQKGGGWAQMTMRPTERVLPHCCLLAASHSHC